MLGLTKLPKSIVLVGMMGVGKTSVGRKLAKSLSVDFCDSDQEVEKAAGHSIANIYKWYGEQAFKDTESRVISRILNDTPHVISTGVETFINEKNRALIKDHGFSIWLYAGVDTLLPRVERRNHRPQLDQGNKRDILEKYIQEYYPIYEHSDLRVDCDCRTPENTVDYILAELTARFWSDV